MFVLLVEISISRLASSYTANELGYEVYAFWIYICFYSGIALTCSWKVLAVGDARKLYYLCTVQLNMSFVNVIGIALAGMVSMHADVFGIIEYVPAPVCSQ